MATKAVVTKDYIAREENELTFIKGDAVTIKDAQKKIVRDSGEWMEGRLDDGTEGIFPLSHVRLEKNEELIESIDAEMARVEAALKQAQLDKEEAPVPRNPPAVLWNDVVDRFVVPGQQDSDRSKHHPETPKIKAPGTQRERDLDPAPRDWEPAELRAAVHVGESYGEHERPERNDLHDQLEYPVPSRKLDN